MTLHLVQHVYQSHVGQFRNVINWAEEFYAEFLS
jgi:hypothetical protein